MAKPFIEFVRLADGKRVAFHVLGKGPAVAMLFPYHVNHLALNWCVPLHRSAMQFLARRFTVINLDLPGAGLSEGFQDDFSLASLSDAVDAVRDAAGVPDLRLVGMGAGGLIACHYAGVHRERVKRLVLIASGESDANRQLLHLRRHAPDVEAEARGALFGGVGDKRNAVALAEVARAALNEFALTRWERLLQQENLLAIASSVSQPALYFHAAADNLVPLSAARALVDNLQNACLRIVEAKSGMHVWRIRAAIDEMVDFLGADFDSRPALARRRSTHADHPAGLSEREVEVIRLLGLGRSNQQIAEELFISLHTVSFHLRSIFAKTGATNRTEAAAFAFQAGLAPRK